MCVRSVTLVSVYTIFLLDFGTVLTVWYFFLLIVYDKILFSKPISNINSVTPIMVFIGASLYGNE